MLNRVPNRPEIPLEVIYVFDLEAKSSFAKIDMTMAMSRHGLRLHAPDPSVLNILFDVP